jgi:U1 small nuclear ribonucleoprotein C
MLFLIEHGKPEIGHEKAQSVIDSITNSYAAEGKSSQNPMLGQNPGVGQPFPPPPFGFPGGYTLCYK